MTKHGQPRKATPSGESLERETQRLYGLLGASTRRRILIKGYEIDVHAVFRRGPLRFTLIIECKEYDPSKAVSDLDMRSFVAKLLAAREAGLADKGVFVTTSTYAKTALATADQHGIQCLTLADLSNQLVDFQPYLGDVTAAFERTDLSKWYIPQTVSELEDYDSLTASGREQALHPDALNYIDQLFSQRHDHRLALLGNFGTGKTSFCLKYRDLLARRALVDASARIPILVDLRDFRSGVDIHQAVTNTLQRVPGLDIDVALCLELQRMGRFFFLLDGLDEMATRVDRAVVNESLRELDRLRVEGNNRYLITCRTHFFQERVVDEFLIDYRTLYLTEWSPRQLHEYLSKRLGSAGDARHRWLTAHPKLAELSRTPLLLDILLAAELPAVGDINIYRLVSGYTDQWISTQSRRRGAVMTPEQRRRFTESLALRLFEADKNALHFSDLYEVAREFSGFRDASRVDHFDADARTCTFLTRDSDGNYGFRHRAFLEYFSASAIATRVEAGDAAALELRELSPEIIEFILDRGVNAKGIDHLQVWSRDFAATVRSLNAVRLLQGFKQTLAHEVQEHYQAFSAEWRDLERLAAGESVTDIDTFWQTYGDRIRVFARRWVAGLSATGVTPDEIAADALMQLWDAARTGRLKLGTALNVDRYLQTVIRRLLVDRLRASKRFMLRSVALADALNMADELQMSPESLFVNKESQERIAAVTEAAIGRLPAPQREVVSLTFEGGLTVDDIAARLGMSPNSVRTIRARALRRLRAELATARLTDR